MTITFQINYRTVWGQSLCVIETKESILGWIEAHPLELTCQGQDFWTASVPVSDFAGEVHYKYAIKLAEGGYIYEAGAERHIELANQKNTITVRDFWQANDYEHAFYSTVFKDALFRRCSEGCGKVQKGSETLKRKKGDCVVMFSIDAPQVLPTQGVAIIGNVDELGNWNEAEKLVLCDAAYPVWKGAIKINKPTDVVEYKYVIYDLHSGKVVDTEYGENRRIWGMREDMTIMQNDRSFRRTQPKWKGAGVAIPVFSLRTENDFGIGEFLDLKPFADWAAATGQKMIQTLPINDTTLTHTNRDSYPYNAVSVFALHPIYINIEKMGKLTPTLKKAYKKEQTELNALSYADYQNVYDKKMRFFRAIFKAEKEAVFSSEEYKAFFEQNKQWLEPYADFLHNRDKEPKEFYYFLQFHADKQLKEAVAYAHSVGVGMKGDIPIGISPDSVDAYTNPELFNLNASAGAPPDDFDARGQNWGFPTYNWDEMAKDNFLWWRRRFTKMQDYFDAYRIDHILGFFRIWQMPKSAVWGLCGHFNPAMPYTMQDLWNMGVKTDRDRLVKPYIRSNFLGEVFGYDSEEARHTFLNTDNGYVYWFKPEFNTQQKVQAYFDGILAKNGQLNDSEKNIMNGLMYLHCEVLFVEDQKNPELLHPRIALYQSHSYNELYDDQKEVMMRIHNDYFYHRHNEFWKASAMRKLPTLTGATDMLVCGEDLGMVPACVPDVMHELEILSLEIQRMPKDPNVTFAHPADAPYMSVCTTGTHDTSPLREWWEEDQMMTQKFFNDQMGWWGEAPKEMSGAIAEFIVNQHMYSPAMWVILPLQDWLAIDEEVRFADAKGERINVPSNPRHFWKYRMHLTVEDLLKKDGFNNHVRELTGRRF
ncbi:MAG: 4-alpha-glucanotransferase [Paludibacteraceae bacterium]|nr:4-alpha-glucanotransferase [Paludibacteraceae bacterium]